MVLQALRNFNISRPPQKPLSLKYTCAKCEKPFTTQKKWKPVGTIAQSRGRGEWGRRGALWRWWWRPPAGPCRSFLKNGQCCLQFYWEFQTVVNVFQWGHLDHSQVGGWRSVGWWVVGYDIISGGCSGGARPTGHFTLYHSTTPPATVLRVFLTGNIFLNKIHRNQNLDSIM